MEITLLRANIDNAKELHAMQVEAFKELLEKYQDFDTRPANENMEKAEARLKRKMEKTKEFPPYLYCQNFKGKALHRKQSGCMKKCMETIIGSWRQFCRNLKIVIFMKRRRQT